MEKLDKLFAQNREWAEKIKQADPDFFTRLSKQQKPEILWIGCSDSRVPANQIIDLPPGEVFVHRNIANLVVADDVNCLSVLQFAVETLKVKYIIVCGHYGCGGVQAALYNQGEGLINNWLQHIKDIYNRNREMIDGLGNESDQINRLCELNVIEQVEMLCRTAVVRAAWRSGQALEVHGWIYSIEDGILRDLDVSRSGDSTDKRT